MLIKLDKQWLRVAVLYWKERWEVMGEGIWQLKGRSSFFGTKNLSLEQVPYWDSTGSREPVSFYFYTSRHHLRGFAEWVSARARGACYLSKASSKTICQPWPHHRRRTIVLHQHPLPWAGPVLKLLIQAECWIVPFGGSCPPHWIKQLQEQGSKSDLQVWKRIFWSFLWHSYL